MVAAHKDKTFKELFLQVKELKVGYQGIEGSYSHQAAKSIMPVAKHAPLVSSANVVKALRDGDIDYGVMAIENSIGGIVLETEKALEKAPLLLTLTFRLKIQHCLFKSLKTPLEAILYVTSHPQALRQTRNHLEKYNWKAVEIEDTAIGAKRIAEGELPNTAVVCSKIAGELYGLELIEENIEDSSDNETTFGLYVAM